MNNKILYSAIFALSLAACTDDTLTPAIDAPEAETEVTIPAGAKSGELLIKFKPEMTEILDQTLSAVSRSGGAASRSGIPSVSRGFSRWTKPLRNVPARRDFTCGMW